MQGEGNDELNDWDEMRVARVRRHASNGSNPKHGDCDVNMMIISVGETWSWKEAPLWPWWLVSGDERHSTQ